MDEKQATRNTYSSNATQLPATNLKSIYQDIQRLRGQHWFTLILQKNQDVS